MQLAEYFRAYNFMRTFRVPYSVYLDTPENVVDTLLEIESEIQEKTERKQKAAERKASGKPVRTRG